MIVSKEELLAKRNALRKEHAEAMMRHEKACDDVARLSRELDKVHAEIKAAALRAYEGNDL